MASEAMAAAGDETVCPGVWDRLAFALCRTGGASGLAEADETTLEDALIWTTMMREADG